MERAQTISDGDPLLHTQSENLSSSLEDFYLTSKCYVTNALDADEQGNTQLAVQNYMNALQCLEKGMSININGLSSEKMADAQDMQSKMAPVLQKVQTRLYELQQTAIVPSAPEYSAELPEGHTTTEAVAAASDANFENGHAGSSHQHSTWVGEAATESAAEILYIPGGVQLYSIEENLHVTTAPPSYPTSLRIFLFDETKSSSSSRPPAFVQVGEWVYPLVPGQSPVLRCNNGAYIFPNLNQSPQHKSVGLVISSALDPSYEEVFAHILSRTALLQVQDRLSDGEPEVNLRSSVPYHPADEERQEKKEERQEKEEERQEEEPSTSQKIASGIETSASWLGWGLSKGAQMTSSLIKLGANHLQKNITPNEEPTSVDPTLKKGLHYTHKASKATVQVSAAMVRGLCYVTNEVAKAASPHIQSFLSSSSSNGNGSSNMSGVLTVAGAGLQGIGTVWKNMEDAGLAVARSVSSATVDTVGHKYGEDARSATSLAMGAAVNCGRTVFNVDNLGIKAIAKRTATDTGKTVLKDYCVGPKQPA